MRKIDNANAETLRRMLAGDPVLVDVVPAGETLQGLGERHILHAGPPIGWERMCGPMRGAVTGIAVFEGWAKDLDDAGKKAAAGSFAFHPNHHFGAVGPMTGLTTRSQPLMVVENKAFGNRAYCAINEGLGKVMRFGGNDAEVLDRLRWIKEVLGPALGRALRETGGIALKPLIARGLTMGDEMHQRNVACSSLLLRQLAPALARTAKSADDLAACLDFIGRNDQFFLNVGMAMGKALTDPARNVDGSSVVTAMSRNGTEFGIRVAGTGDRWYTAPVGPADGLFFPGYGPGDANPDMGDSAITETLGIGGFAMAASPSITTFVGGTPADALAASRSMRRITLAPHPAFPLPPLNFAGSPSGIDVLKVLDTCELPLINTGIAHREAGVGQIGAGIVTAPPEVFLAAVHGLADARGVAT